MFTDLQRQMLRAPEGYLTAAAAAGFLAGILLRIRR